MSSAKSLGGAWSLTAKTGTDYGGWSACPRLRCAAGAAVSAVAGGASGADDESVHAVGRLKRGVAVCRSSPCSPVSRSYLLGLQVVVEDYVHGGAG